MTKLVLVYNDGFRQAVPVSVVNSEVMALEDIELSFADSQQILRAGSLVGLYDCDSEELLLELDAAILEGFIVQTAEIDVDFRPKSLALPMTPAEFFRREKELTNYFF